MYAEITKTMFSNNVAGNREAYKAEENELASKFYYMGDDKETTFMIIYNHIGAIVQYYIQDINA